LSVSAGALGKHNVISGFGHSSFIENDPIVISILLFFGLIFQTDIVIKVKRVIRNKTGKLVKRVGLILPDNVLIQIELIWER